MQVCSQMDQRVTGYAHKLTGVFGPLEGLQRALKWCSMIFSETIVRMFDRKPPGKHVLKGFQKLPEAPAEKPEIANKPITYKEL